MTDRRGTELCLGPTHEELVTGLVAGEVGSYRDLPLRVFQIQTKYRDELRPRAGLLRSRDFVMKDAYSFHDGQDSLRETYRVMYDAYERVFTRCGLRFRAVEAQAGEIGGDVNHEFMAPTEVGEDLVVYAPAGTYAANLEAATCARPAPVESGTRPLLRAHTPGARSVDEVAGFLGIPASQILKCLLYKIPDGAATEVVAALCPGDREVNEHKLARVLGAVPVLLDAADFAAHPALVRGHVGPVGLAPHVARIVAVIPLGRKVDPTVVQAVTDALAEAGLDVLVDDRPGGSAGVRFADADLIGCPYQVIVGRRAAEGIVELRSRDRSVVTETLVDDLVTALARLRHAH
ncbi:aminoacyl--tRNA ligase-related protein [Pseudofrankia sp. BMG5.37]|uniref:aminoacyl--tRNA ligase-related protein n=1 Tax=Pseudofrankia sp. BMG5.37 TaxID=3050035 RepID=UPI00289525ED|nr:aminoacyl--tRNA ligase-related protein [Pseudofrankia sp. BMG5.37]MDT3442760.1 YbaK/EbsC family protein [Pseudofrankia sp. BMG5.37]